MRISINQAERLLAQLALDLGDKECERARKSLEQLHVDAMMVMALQGRVGELRTALKSSEHHFDWGFDDRRALAICLRIYRDKLRALASSEEKLLVETASADEKITDIGDFLGRLAGQESLFRDDDAPPPKLTPEGLGAVRHAVEIGAES